MELLNDKELGEMLLKVYNNRGYIMTLTDDQRMQLMEAAENESWRIKEIYNRIVMTPPMDIDNIKIKPYYRFTELHRLIFELKESIKSEGKSVIPEPKSLIMQLNGEIKSPPVGNIPKPEKPLKKPPASEIPVKFYVYYHLLKEHFEDNRKGGVPQRMMVVMEKKEIKDDVATKYPVNPDTFFNRYRDFKNSKLRILDFIRGMKPKERIELNKVIKLYGNDNFFARYNSTFLDKYKV